jgi:hypothetical protein
MFLTGKAVKSTVNEPFGKTMGTFFGKIQGVPTGYLIGTPWSHHLENCKCANHFLHREHCKKTGTELSTSLASFPKSRGGFEVVPETMDLMISSGVFKFTRIQRGSLDRFDTVEGWVQPRCSPFHCNL